MVAQQDRHEHGDDFDAAGRHEHAVSAAHSAPTSRTSSSDSTYYGAYEASLQALQWFQDDAMANAGFANISYKGILVVYDANCPARMYFLNSEYLFLRPYKNQFDKLDRRNSYNQHAFTIPVVWYRTSPAAIASCRASSSRRKETHT